MTMIEPIELTYDLHLMAPGRFPFRRWRWELWHGPRLLAAGWRVTPTQARHAVRAHAWGYVHRFHGLHPLRAEDALATEAAWSGQTISYAWGDLQVVLSPRALLAAPPRLVPAAG